MRATRFCLQTSASAAGKFENVASTANRSFQSRIQPHMHLYRDPLQYHFVPELERTRLVPAMASFYARNPHHAEHMAQLQNLLNKNATLPFDRRQSSGVSWITFREYKEKAGGDLLKESEYSELVKTLKRLDNIASELKTEEVQSTIAQYSRSNSGLKDTRSVKQLDAQGRAVAVGRRKSSSARVFVVKSQGQSEILVNGVSLEEAFPKLQDRLKLLYPLELVGMEGKYNVFGLVRGGGPTGQADALKLAVSKALCIHNPLFKQKLSSAGCLHRDPRRVERKKPGKLGARKMPTWVKR